MDTNETIDRGLERTAAESVTKRSRGRTVAGVAGIAIASALLSATAVAVLLRPGHGGAGGAPTAEPTSGLISDPYEAFASDAPELVPPALPSMPAFPPIGGDPDASMAPGSTFDPNLSVPGFPGELPQAPTAPQLPELPKLPSSPSGPTSSAGTGSGPAPQVPSFPSLPNLPGGTDTGTGGTGTGTGPGATQATGSQSTAAPAAQPTAAPAATPAAPAATPTAAPAQDPAPIARNDSWSMSYYSYIDLPVFDNDEDSGARFADGSPFRLQSLTGATYGDLYYTSVACQDGSGRWCLRYYPMNSVYEDTFTYTIVDVAGNRDTATVTIRIG